MRSHDLIRLSNKDGLRGSSCTTSTLSGPGGEQRVQFLFVCFYPLRESRPEARALIDRLQGIRPLAATSRDPEHQRREQRDDHLHVAIGQQEGGLAQTAMIPFCRAAASAVL